MRGQIDLIVRDRREIEPLVIARGQRRCGHAQEGRTGGRGQRVDQEVGRPAELCVEDHQLVVIHLHLGRQPGVQVAGAEG